MEPISESTSAKPIADAFLAVRSDHECFGCGDRNPIGLHLRFSPVAEGVSAPYVPALEHQGFHGMVHGGIVSSVLDEAMAWATANAGIWAVTGEMTVRFRFPLEVGERTTVTAKVEGDRGRIIAATAELIRDRDNATIATASARFVRVSETVEKEWRARYLKRPESS